MTGLHFIDYAVVATYFAIILILGRVASKKSVSTGENFFLAGRKLGKVYQFFLNFGNGVSANDSVSTTSVIYKQGASGVWISLQMIFLNPYYWFMYSWFRRVRLTTTADLFEDRLGSRRLATFYAVFQIVMAVAVTMGFSNLVSYKIASALVIKEESAWTPAERQSVTEHRELTALEETPAGGLPAESLARRTVLRERLERGELHSYVSGLEPWSFYFIYTLAIGIYIVMGGMVATAITEVFQSLLIVAFSFVLIPAGLAAVGGWGQVRHVVPGEMLQMFGAQGASDFTAWTVAAVLFATLMQTHAGVGNMGLAGSARNEFAARFGAAAGNYGKRIMTLLWALCGLIAIGLFAGKNTLADPDLVWGAMSLKLLGPGLLGLMFAGILAANMSTIAAQSMFVSALFARNIYVRFKPAATEADVVRSGRWTIIIVLALGVAVATQLSNVYTVLQFALTINVPFGAAIMLMFIWRRVTAAGVWAAVIGAICLNIIFPLVAAHVPALATHPTLVARAEDAAGRPVPVFFEKVVRTQADNLQSPLTGEGRLHTELVLLQVAGVDVVHLSSGHRLAARFFMDALIPLLLLIGVSLLSRGPPQRQVDLFFGKMKTPVAATPEQDVAEMAATEANPHRFDHLKLWRRSSLEFTRWNTEDAVGFAACCALTLGIVALFWGMLTLLR